MLARLRIVASVATLLFSITTYVQAATLDGATLSAIWSYPPVGTPDPTVSVAPNPFVVGAGVETIFDIENGRVFLSANFQSNLLIFTVTTASPLFFLSDAFNGPIFSAVSAVTFPGILTTSTSNGGSIAASIIANELNVDFRGWAFASGDTATVTFAEVVTPLPAALPLFASGLATVVFLTRRRARYSAPR
jgi:hypothetical protein